MATLFDLVSEEIAKRDGGPAPTDPGWAAEAFLLASAVLGTDAHAIAEEMHMDPVMVGVFAERARANGLWTDSGVRSARWEDKKTGGVAFACDANIVLGHIVSTGPDTYSLTDAGRAHVERLMAKE